MTSVSVISSSVERMKCLRNLEKDTGSLSDEAEGLLKDLEEMKKLLATAYDHKVELGAKLEKEVVRISYDVVYTITDALKPATGIFDHFNRSSGSDEKLKELKVQLQPFKEELTEKVYPDQTVGLVRDPNSSAATSPPLEKASTKLEPKRRHYGISAGINSGISFMGRGVKNIGHKVITNKTPESTANSETQGEDKAAGSDERPADQSITGPKINEEDRADLLDRLKTKLMPDISKDNPPEMYIVGKSGMGKSTLVRELYYDEKIRDSFNVYGWVTVGHNFRIKGVLQLLLQQLGPWQEDQQQQEPLDLSEMNEIELISQIFDVVEDKSYLLVLEDIGSVTDWENIRLALPLANSTCRVIITTCSKDFSSLPNCHEILGLTHSETLTLLNKEAVFDPEVREAIARISGGSPLYTTILAKSLKSEANNKNLVEELGSYESKKGTHHVLGACYKRLPPELKPCFLYLGQLPPNHDILVDELYQLLAAENLIMPQAGNATISHQTLCAFLKKLADLKLVQVAEDLWSENKLYKSCWLHDQVREFCNWQGLDEEFHRTVNFGKLKKVVVEPYTHRLAIYMNEYKEDATFVFRGNDTARKILSLLIFDAFESAEERPGWPSEMDDLVAFAHLRILIFDEVNFKLRTVPRGIEKLNPLRFLSFRGCFLVELPSSLSSLKQVETLDLRVKDDCNIIIPSNVFASMKRMVHLFFPRLYQKKGKNKLTLKGLTMLETLTNFNTEVFEVADLSKLKRLKVLSTVSSGQSPTDIDSIVDLLNERKEELHYTSVEITSFDCYNGASISALRKLMQCRFVHYVKVEGQIEKLPAEEGGGDRVVEMFLDGSELELDPMEYFGKFQKLQSLVLANDAFIGDVLVIPTASRFPKLRSLKLQNLQYLDKLVIEKGTMPHLSSLRIESCGSSLELTIPEEMFQRLKEIGGDGYSVVPSPSKLITTS